MTDTFEPFKFDIKMAQSLVDSAIEKKGDGFIYERQGGECLYVHNGMRWSDRAQDYVASDDVTPGCIWGHALTAAGIPFEEFEDYEGDDVETLVRGLTRSGHLADYDGLATAWAAAVQSGQDAGLTWSKARDSANRLLKESKKNTLREEDRPDWIRIHM